MGQTQFPRTGRCIFALHNHCPGLSGLQSGRQNSEGVRDQRFHPPATGADPIPRRYFLHQPTAVAESIPAESGS